MIDVLVNTLKGITTTMHFNNIAINSFNYARNIF